MLFLWGSDLSNSEVMVTPCHHLTIVTVFLSLLCQKKTFLAPKRLLLAVHQVCQSFRFQNQLFFLFFLSGVVFWKWGWPFSRIYCAHAQLPYMIRPVWRKPIISTTISSETTSRMLRETARTDTKWMQLEPFWSCRHQNDEWDCSWATWKLANTVLSADHHGNTNSVFVCFSYWSSYFIVS